MTDKNIDFIKIDPKEDELLLVEKYQKDTDTTLFPGQDARILINLMVYYANLVKSQINEAAKLNLVEYSKAPILDFLGKYKNCPRNLAQSGYDRIKIKLKKPFNKNYVLSRGFQVCPKDGLYIFETTKDVTFLENEIETIAEIKSLEETNKVNEYSAGEINTIVSSSFDFIESVENLDGVSGGCDDENNENYIKRILLSPEGFSVAGPEGAYIYFIKSAHPSIKDVSIDVPVEDIKVILNNIETTIKESVTETDNFNISLDNINEEITLQLNKNLNQGDILKVKIPHPYKICPYVLTEDGEASKYILDCVATALKTVRPLSDYVILNSAVIESFEISGTVYLEQEADLETSKEKVNTILNDFLNSVNNSLNVGISINKIKGKVSAIEGVYDFNLNSLTNNLPAKKEICYKGTIGTIKFERVNYEQ